MNPLKGIKSSRLRRWFLADVLARVQSAPESVFLQVHTTPVFPLVCVVLQ
jgi:hypothetical protein